MKKVTIALIMLTICLPVYATTVKGSASVNREALWAVMLADPTGGAQVSVTLSWTKASADLFVLVVCDVGITEIFGAGSAPDMDRVQRVEAGVFGTVCGFGVASFKGGSKFTLSVLDAADPALQKLSSGPAQTSMGGLVWSEAERCG